MINLNTLDDLANLRESVEVECKLAAGADGRGRLPREFWPTYSAFANTRGGVILLGLREDAGHFSVQGMEDADRVVSDLFNTANNREKVSINLLEDTHVRRLKLDGKELIAVEVPAADRKQKPVKPDHPWASGDSLTLLRALGAWDQDPETLEEDKDPAGVAAHGRDGAADGCGGTV